MPVGIHGFQMFYSYEERPDRDKRDNKLHRHYRSKRR
jgi:hypothetical protein